MTESFEALLEESLAQKNLRPGTIVTGTIMEIRAETVVVNAGLKSEGIVPIAQFKNLKGELEVEVGDEVQVALDTLEDGFGETRLSRDKAKRALVWDKLESAFEDDETVEGKISGKVKGGFTVDIEDIRAFLPGSLVDVRPVRDPTYLEGKDLEFKIIKLDRKRNNIVVSRRAVVESEFSAEREALLDTIEEGKPIKRKSDKPAKDKQAAKQAGKPVWALAGLAAPGPEITAFHSIIKQAPDTVPVILIILGCIDATLGRNTVGPSGAVLVAEGFNFKSHLSHGGCCSCTGQAGPDYNHIQFPFVGRIDQVLV